MALTQAQVSNLKTPAQGRVYLVDTRVPGLRLQLTATGARTWQLVKRIDGRVRTITVARGPAVTLDQARRAAEEVLRSIELGRFQAPADVRRQMRSAPRLDAFADEYLERYATKPSGKTGAPRRVDTIRSETSFVKMTARALGDVALDQIDEAAIDRLQRHYRGQQATLRAVTGALTRLLRDAVARGHKVGINPAEIGRVAPGAPRERVLSLDELRTIIAAAEAMEGVGARIVWLSALLPMRRSEAASLTWRDISIPDRKLSIPGSRTKNGAPNDMPLISRTVDYFTAAKPDKARPDALVFNTGSGRPFSGWSKAVNAVRNAAQVFDWSMHDFRRTFASMMAEHTAHPADVIDGLLNHRAATTTGGVMSVYQRSNRWPLRVQVMRDWEALLDG